MAGLLLGRRRSYSGARGSSCVQGRPADRCAGGQREFRRCLPAIDGVIMELIQASGDSNRSGWGPEPGVAHVPERPGSGHASLHRQFLLEAVDVAVDRGDGEHLAIAAIAHHAIARLDVAVYLERVPLLGMTDIVDRQVVMLAPEERNIGKALAPPQYIARDSLTLALGDDPVFDPELFPAVAIRPP